MIYKKLSHECVKNAFFFANRDSVITDSRNV